MSLKLEPSQPVALRGLGGGVPRGLRFPTVNSCPELGPELQHQLSYNLRAKIERGSGPATEPGRMGTGPASEDARAGPDPGLNLPWRQVAPTPAQCPWRTPSFSQDRVTGPQSGKGRRARGPWDPSNPSPPDRWGARGPDRTQTCPRSPSVSRGWSPCPEGVPWPLPHLPWV